MASEVDIEPIEFSKNQRLPVRQVQTETERLLAADLPSEDDYKKYIGLVVTDAVKQILLGKLQYKSAGEASKVARDFVSIAKDFGWVDVATDLKKAENAADRKEAFEYFKNKAEGKLSE